MWADGIALGPNGSVLLTDSQTPAYIDPLLRPPAKERIDGAAPHRIYRMRMRP